MSVCRVRFDRRKLVLKEISSHGQIVMVVVPLVAMFTFAIFTVLDSKKAGLLWEEFSHGHDI